MPPMERGPIGREVIAFVDRMGVALAELSGKSAEHHRADATVEAGDLVAAIMDADGRFTDAELDAYLDGVGGQLDPPLIVTPRRLREGRSLVGRSDWLARPSTLFDILVLADRRDGGTRSHGYYDAGPPTRARRGRRRPGAVGRTRSPPSTASAR